MHLTNFLCIIKELTLKVSMLLSIRIERIYDNPKGNGRDFRIFMMTYLPLHRTINSNRFHATNLTENNKSSPYIQLTNIMLD